MKALLPNGLELHYQATGAGLPVVLIHGLRCSHHSWRHQVPALSRHLRVIALDLRGHGQSSKPPGPYSMELFAEDVRQVLDQLDISRAVLVGHSMGGGVAQTFAFNYPERLLALGLVATSSELPERVRTNMRQMANRAEHLGTLPPTTNSVRGWVAPQFAVTHPEEIEREARAMSTDGRAFAASCRANAERDWTSKLGQIGCPTLFVGGELDSAGMVESARRYRERLADVQIHLLPGVGHMVPMEAPDQLNSLLLGFVAGLDGSTTTSPSLR